MSFFYNWVEQMNNDAGIAEAVKKYLNVTAIPR